MSQKTTVCRSCGASVELSDEYVTQFCPYCGAQLEAPAAVPQPTPQPASRPAVQPEAQPVRKAPSAPLDNDFRFEPSTQDTPAQSPLRFGRGTPRRTAGRFSPARWYAGVAAWFIAWFVMLYLILEDYLVSYSGSALAAVVILATFPFWFPLFHPDRGRKKSVGIVWTLILLGLMAFAYFVIEELL